MASTRHRLRTDGSQARVAKSSIRELATRHFHRGRWPMGPRVVQRSVMAQNQEKSLLCLVWARRSFPSRTRRYHLCRIRLPSLTLLALICVGSSLAARVIRSAPPAHYQATTAAAISPYSSAGGQPATASAAPPRPSSYHKTSSSQMPTGALHTAGRSITYLSSSNHTST